MDLSQKKKLKPTEALLLQATNGRQIVSNYHEHGTMTVTEQIIAPISLTVEGDQKPTHTHPVIYAALVSKLWWYSNLSE